MCKGKTNICQFFFKKFFLHLSLRRITNVLIIYFVSKMKNMIYLFPDGHLEAWRVFWQDGQQKEFGCNVSFVTQTSFLYICLCLLWVRSSVTFVHGTPINKTNGVKLIKSRMNGGGRAHFFRNISFEANISKICKKSTHSNSWQNEMINNHWTHVSEKLNKKTAFCTFAKRASFIIFKRGKLINFFP